MKGLIVADRADPASVYERVADEAGHNVIVVREHSAARRHLSTKPDFMIIDDRMGTGLAVGPLIRIARQFRPSIRILLMRSDPLRVLPSADLTGVTQLSDAHVHSRDESGLIYHLELMAQPA